MGYFNRVQPLYFLFHASKRHCFERKTKTAFCEDCFDTWMILVFRYIVIKTS